MKINAIRLFTIATMIFGIIFFISSFTFIGGQNGQPIETIDPSIQWEFFEKQLISPKQAKKAYGTGERISFPHVYKEHYSSVEMYGTYIAKVKLPKVEKGENLAVYVPFEYGSYTLYVDHQLVAKNGVVGTTKAQQIPENAPKIGQIHSKNKEVYITLQLSNFYSLRGGFSKPIYIGPFSELVNKHNSAIIFHFFINGIIFVASIFSLLVGLFNNRNKRMIIFAVFSFIISVRAVFARPFLYSITVFNIPWHYGVKIEAICTVLALSFAITFFTHLIFPFLNKSLFWVAQAMLAIQLILTIFTEPLIFQKTSVYTVLVALILLLFMMIKGLLKTEILTAAITVHFIGSLVIIMATIHDLIVIFYGINNSPLLVQHSQAIYVMLVCIAISWKYAQKQKDEQHLKAKILSLNTSLDLKIKERTAQLEKANESLQQLATKDALTGIANRYAFDQQLELYFEQAQQTKNNLSILLIDLDYFKKYNDHYGHVLGDTLLQQVVATINAQLPPNAFFARYGGEEFAIIYPCVDEQQLSQLGEKIVKAVSAQRFEHILHPSGYATISVGCYTMTANDSFTSKKQLINASDERLYEAKHNGRNQFVK